MEDNLILDGVRRGDFRDEFGYTSDIDAGIAALRRRIAELTRLQAGRSFLDRRAHVAELDALKYALALVDPITL